MENKNINEKNIDLITELESLIEDNQLLESHSEEEIIIEPLALEILQEKNIEVDILASQDYTTVEEKNVAVTSEKKE